MRLALRYCNGAGLWFGMSLILTAYEGFSVARGLTLPMLTMKKSHHTRFFATSSMQESSEFSKNTKVYRRFEMKRSMLVAAMVLGFAGMSFAQTSANGTANISLKMLEGMQMTVTGSVDFGNVATGTTGALTPVNPTAGAKFDVSGTSGATFELNAFPSTVTLSDGNGNNATFNVNLVQSTDGTTAGAAAAAGTPYTLSGTYPTGTGHFYFLLGGGITLTGSEPAGTYTGTFTLTAVYN